MRRSFHTCVAIALIGLWIAPGAGALVVGLHLAEHHQAEHHQAEHHRSHEEDSHHHHSLASEIAVAVAHGHHHHSATVPDHDHPVPLEGAADLRLSTTVKAIAPSQRVTRPWRDQGRRISGSRHRPGSAGPLFYAHCSLLL